MRARIKEQLDKCQVNLPVYDINTTHLIIPKQGTFKASGDIVAGGVYVIRVEDYIIKPYDGFTLHQQWNNNVVPTDNMMRVKVLQIMGKMVKVNSVGINNGSYWTGWLPRKSFKIMEE